MSIITEFKQIIHDLPLPLSEKSDREKVAHFCEHHGIFIQFTRARSIWHALAPSAIKPWWLMLQPARTQTNNNKKNATEVAENA